MRKKLRNLSYNHRIALTILLFTLLPCILLEAFYLKNACSDWTRAALLTYQNDADSNALLLSTTISSLQSKMDYVRNSSSVRSSIAQINRLSLVQALDFITVLNETEASITADNRNLVVRWYPYLSARSYGNYCYPLMQFTGEFPLGGADPCCQEILSLHEGQFLWKVRELSREINNTGALEKRLCLYTRMANLNGSDCLLEFSLPVSGTLTLSNFESVPGSLSAIYFDQADAPLVIILDSPFSLEDTEAMILRYREKDGLSGYDAITSPVPNAADSQVLLLLPSSYVNRLTRPYIVAFVLISILIAVLIIGASYLTSHLLTKRILHTVNDINNDLNRILLTPINNDDSQDDIRRISLGVRRLVQNTQEYCARLERYEAEALRMELELLQMRFNPHLLYNSLGAIRYQVKNPTIRDSIDSLCHYYRIVLNNGNLFLPLKDEFDMVKEYLAIEKFAYQLTDIQFDFKMDEEIADCTIIKHLLQPIVENALKHGLRPLKQDGRLELYAFSDKDCICIRVADNGLGMSDEAARQLLLAPAPGASQGYGIYNVRQRIQVYYGTEYGLTINSKAGSGTTVLVKIPKQLPASTQRQDPASHFRLPEQQK